MTVRACKDQWNLLKKGTSKTAKSSPRTPSKSASSGNTRKQTLTSTPSLALRNKHVKAETPNTNSSSKKRKLHHELDDLEIMQDTKSSPDEGELTSEETDEDILDDATTASTPTIRRQPPRSRARSKTVIIDDLSSNNEADEDNEGDVDSDFDLEKDYESKLTPAARTQRKREKKRMLQREQASDIRFNTHAKVEDDYDAVSNIAIVDNYVGLGGEDVDNDDASSQTTKRTSWQTAASQFDAVDED